MGRPSEGILGGFNGTVGIVVGSRWRGIPVLTVRPHSICKVFSVQDKHKAAGIMSAPGSGPVKARFTFLHQIVNNSAQGLKMVRTRPEEG